MKLRGRARRFDAAARDFEVRPSKAAKAAERFRLRVLIVAVERIEGVVLRLVEEREAVADAGTGGGGKANDDRLGRTDDEAFDSGRGEEGGKGKCNISSVGDRGGEDTKGSEFVDRCANCGTIDIVAIDEGLAWTKQSERLRANESRG